MEGDENRAHKERGGSGGAPDDPVAATDDGESVGGKLDKEMDGDEAGGDEAEPWEASDDVETATDDAVELLAPMLHTAAD